MPLFGSRTETKTRPETREEQADVARRKEGAREERAADASLEEQLSELTASERAREVERARSQAEETIHSATIEDIKDITLIQSGRCPDCGGKVETFLFTSVCGACGWFRRSPSDMGHCLIHLNTGETITADRVLAVKNNVLLCVRDGVVTDHLAAAGVRRIEYRWREGELEQALREFHRQRRGTCAWCEKLLDTGDEDPIEEYVAFGAFQERYRFCGEECLSAFRRQYPVRIHRNCYETDCNVCEKCVKKYDTSGFRRHQVR